MKTIEIKCDGCGHDLTDAGAMPTFRLELAAERVLNSGNVIYSVNVHPAIDRSYHFCGLPCLDLWRDRERLFNQLWAERSEKWQDENGRDIGEGMRTWSMMPEELRLACNTEFRETALKAFPMERPSRR